MKIKKVSVEYIESGTFVGGEEDCFLSGIKRGDDCFVISHQELGKIQNAIDAVFKDESGDLEFVKYKIKEIMSRE